MLYRIIPEERRWIAIWEIKTASNEKRPIDRPPGIAFP